MFLVCLLVLVFDCFCFGCFRVFDLVVFVDDFGVGVLGCLLALLRWVVLVVFGLGWLFVLFGFDWWVFVYFV